MGQYLLDFAFLILLLIANGFLSMAEMAIVSSRRPRLQTLADDGKPGAARALALAEEPGDFLSTVQIGITAIGIFTGAFGGATLSVPVADLIARVPALASYAQPIAVFLVVLVTTYLSLIVAELTPKRIALNNPEQLAAVVAGPMTFLARLAHPLVVLLNRSSEWLARVLGVRPSGAPAVTDEEVRIMLQQGAQTGIFEPIEEEIVTQVFRLSDRRASAIMTPRTDIDWIEVGQSEQEIRDLIMESSHSRFPLAEAGLDHVVGVVFVRDLLLQRMTGATADLQSIARPALFLPESMTALDVIESMRESRSHMALIINEYGGLEGLVTINDIVEAILGSVEEVGEEEAEIVEREDGSWLIDGMLSVDEFQDVFRVPELPARDELDYQTVGGMIMAILERVPAVGNAVKLDGLRLEVMDMDGRRVDKVLVQRIGDAGAGESTR
ncbi:MAG: hemolysin family protein [Caldilinea sp.]|nr:HlyC/CorC family transporter [Caldilinea sp.]MCB9122046.1 HlyC/CorC family transporter [Caldilineaceae bacterium]MCB0038579.1 HlyC/CorC family transporter [Caldilinea sp.]MCB9122948.1 HlyC/CorC family transporter [Caldilineaceae bacterium]MCO5213193.1 hemolysin family protein [Caldilinea sp.]